MATPTLNLSSSSFECKTSSRITTPPPTPPQGCLISSLRFPHQSFPRSFNPSLRVKPARGILHKVSALVEEEPASVSVAVAEPVPVEEDKAAWTNASPPSSVKPCELYVCNIPRSCDESQLLDLFKPHGAVQSVQISRNLETGISKGCGYVTMSSTSEAIAAVIALDESDVGGREMRVKFTDDMNKKKNMEIFDSVTNKSTIFESPHKLYVGNLVWSMKSEILRDHFSQYGTVVSVRVIHDRKAGNNRVYGFISFSSEDELKAAMSSNGTEILGRKMVIRSALSSEPK